MCSVAYRRTSKLNLQCDICQRQSCLSLMSHTVHQGDLMKKMKSSCFSEDVPTGAVVQCSPRYDIQLD